jgi:hypothetical protein
MIMASMTGNAPLSWAIFFRGRSRLPRITGHPTI